MSRNITPTRRKNRKRAHRPQDSGVAELIWSLITQCGDPTRVLELHYWSLEPGLIDIMRGLAALPEKSRATLQAFLAMAPDPSLIDVGADAAGRVTFQSPQVAETMMLAEDLVDEDADKDGKRQFRLVN